LKNKLQNYLIALIIFLILIPILCYINYFWRNSISTNPADWGPFGDFFGGVLNSFFSLLTLIVTIYIAVEISKIEDKRNAKVLDFEKKRFLNELRESEYRRISLELQKVSLAVTEHDGGKVVFDALMHLRHFSFCSNHLFPFLQEKETKELIEALSDVYKMLGKVNNEEQQKKFSTYLKAVVVFSTKIQEFILREL
jgi:uncharacterized membrane protein